MPISILTAIMTMTIMWILMPTTTILTTCVNVSYFVVNFFVVGALQKRGKFWHDFPKKTIKKQCLFTLPTPQRCQRFRQIWNFCLLLMFYNIGCQKLSSLTKYRHGIAKFLKTPERYREQKNGLAYQRSYP